MNLHFHNMYMEHVKDFVCVLKALASVKVSPYHFHSTCKTSCDLLKAQRKERYLSFCLPLGFWMNWLNFQKSAVFLLTVSEPTDDPSHKFSNISSTVKV